MASQKNKGAVTMNRRGFLKKTTSAGITLAVPASARTVLDLEEYDPYSHIQDPEIKDLRKRIKNGYDKWLVDFVSKLYKKTPEEITESWRKMDKKYYIYRCKEILFDQK